ncbi:L-glutamate gamma-semialdehyde dehydrogenase [Nocardioides jiangxiensis]|uniref:L-glutamate gamma-semialdehyde dehydrogenase n=1 Tax=Nocardioides jiangxiensis TaxID=3064524 RepID=A0ABT9B3W4_9ACTN|nr:L-glutamate gamma-semialdehyde dehydrogenase [Nocardioides sp. WY-20]MDO7868948.1 L-glutamate gamma-semialdehyde dehydrogenase [Nocardioides sp. WY-20]
MDATTHPPTPRNEPVLDYAPGTAERAQLAAELARQSAEERDLPAYIAGEWRAGGGADGRVVAPHDHQRVLGHFRHATTEDTARALAGAKAAAPGWRELPYDERAAVFLRAAELLAGPWRQRLNAATMLGQSKTVVQAEIDAACELVDFWRFNVLFGRRILEEQPELQAPGVWNRLDHRPLEGFVYAITPFNFTSIAGNLPTAPALMGNVVVWKPSVTQQLAASLTMELLVEAGLPPGVISMLPGHGTPVSEVALADPDLAGIHFTGSTATFRHLWSTVGERIASYRSYPRLVGETGGKDFVVAHPSADAEALRVALLRGAFEYQGQKCSAASRAYVSRTVWERMGEQFLADVDALGMGDPAEFEHFMGAVIDQRAFRRVTEAIERARRTPGLRIAAGGEYDDRVGWFIRPTVVLADAPTDPMFGEEYFGPLLAVHVFEDDQYDAVVDQLEGFAPYALTGAVFATDRAAIARTAARLRFAAGNFYVNDKPTGAVVGQQPFGGARASGTDDKAGSAENLRRWTSTRTVKETLVPPRDHRYPHMGT